LPWSANVPVFAVAIVLVGALQHRLAGLGHESSHYSFMKNHYLNDLVPDLFCMFPLMTTIHFYRLFHMGHHQFTNDPDRDPDLLNLGHGKRASEFPMPRSRFIALVYFTVLVAPLRFLSYQWAYFKVNTLGKGKNIYSERAGHGEGSTGNWPRLATALGILYIIVFSLVLRFLTGSDRPLWLAPAGLAGIAVLGGVIYALPEWAVFQSPFRQAYTPRIAGFLRMSYYTILLVALAYCRWATGGRSAIYPVVLWIVPMTTSCMFFMFLRDVYQHSNADAGRLTNSRVFFTDPFTRWAVFVYGQDMHIPHHLFPAIPHYRLRRLHELLRASHADYREAVVETHGTFHDPLGRSTILDEMTRPQAGPALESPETHALLVAAS
jgi:fatty acid desaturase